MNKHTHMYYIYIHIKISYINENFEITVARMDASVQLYANLNVHIYILYINIIFLL